MKKKFTMFMIGTVLTCTTFAGSIFAETSSKSNEIQVAAQTKVMKGVEMVSLREVSEKLGFTVTWNTKENTIYLDDGVMNTTLTVGVDSYYAASSTAIGMSAPQSFGSGPLLIDGKVYVPAEMFRALLGNAENAVETSNGAATFTKSVEDNTENKNDEGVQMPSPYTEHDSIEGLRAAVDFDFKIPTRLPAGYELSSMLDISNDVIDMRWSKENSEILYRVAKGEEQDISGDYNVYDHKLSINIGDTSITLKGNKDKIHVAIWQEGQRTYAITSTDGLSQQEVEGMIRSIHE